MTTAPATGPVALPTNFRWSSNVPWIGVALGLVATTILSAFERIADATAAPDRSLSFALGVVGPLACWALARAMADGNGWAAQDLPLARYGADRRRLATRRLLLVMSGALALFPLLATIALVFGRGLADPLLGADLVASLPVAAATGLAYGGWLTFGARFGSRGGGAVVLLLVDWIVGSMSFPVVALVPRGHLRHLLGLESVLDFPQWVSFPCLALFAAAGCALSAARVPR